MGLASGSGGRSSGGGSFIYLSNKTDTQEPSPQAFIAALLVGGIIIGGTIAYVSLSGKGIKTERKEFETKLAEDAGVKQFNLDYFDWLTENDKYFFTFSGNAIKMDGKPVDFLLTKYNVSQKNYYELITYIEKNNIKGLDTAKGLFPRILEVVADSEMVSNTLIDELSNTVYDKESGETIAIKDIKMPVVNKKDKTVSYLVHLIKFNKHESKDASLDFITKRITVPLVKELEEMPSLAYFAPKEAAKVKTIKSVNVAVNDFDYFIFNGKAKTSDLEMNF